MRKLILLAGLVVFSFLAAAQDDPFSQQMSEAANWLSGQGLGSSNSPYSQSGQYDSTQAVAALEQQLAVLEQQRQETVNMVGSADSRVKMLDEQIEFSRKMLEKIKEMGTPGQGSDGPQ